MIIMIPVSFNLIFVRVVYTMKKNCYKKNVFFSLKINKMLNYKTTKYKKNRVRNS